LIQLYEYKFVKYIKKHRFDGKGALLMLCNCRSELLAIIPAEINV